MSPCFSLTRGDLIRAQIRDHADQPTFRWQPRPVKAEWRMRVSDGWAHAELWTHPIGWEVRIYWNNTELNRSQAYRDLADAYRDIDDTKVRLEGYNAERLKSQAADK